MVDRRSVSEQPGRRKSKESAMRTIGTSTGLAGFALLALIAGSAACATETRVIISDGTGADGTATGSGEATDPSTTGDPNAIPPLATGLTITEVAIFQAVKVSVVKDAKAVGASTRNAPVVANRPALVRVYVSPTSAYKGGSVTAELRLADGTTPLPIVKDTKTIGGASTDESISSTFNFEVPAESLPPGVTYQVLLTAKDGVAPIGALDGRFPRDGSAQSLDVQTSGKLKLVIVPVKYDADGSGRTPDVSAAQLERYRQTFMARYAASDVEVTARAPWSYASAIGANGAGFSQVLSAITNLRKTDQVEPDVYYYGALAPKSTFSSFCGGGCVTGLSTVVDSPKSTFLRASVGVGFPGQDSVNTAAHEVGHAHGREHAPCGGAQSVDPSFPYSGGVIGTWGYDIFAKTFLSPTKGRDMMGYCPNEWVSDYTYTALFDRIAAVNGNPASTAVGSTSNASAQSFAASQTFRMATVEADGSVTWGGEVELDEEPTDGQSRLVTFVSASGREIGTNHARFYPYDHLPGGVLVVPPAPRDSMLNAKARVVPTWSSVRISGLSAGLTR
jgi:hypothetical protein